MRLSFSSLLRDSVQGKQKHSDVHGDLVLDPPSVTQCRATGTEPEPDPRVEFHGPRLSASHMAQCRATYSMPTGPQGFEMDNGGDAQRLPKCGSQGLWILPAAFSSFLPSLPLFCPSVLF